MLFSLPLVHICKVDITTSKDWSSKNGWEGYFDSFRYFCHLMAKIDWSHTCKFEDHLSDEPYHRFQERNNKKGAKLPFFQGKVACRRARCKMRRQRITRHRNISKRGILIKFVTGPSGYKKFVEQKVKHESRFGDFEVRWCPTTFWVEWDIDF